MKLFTNYTQEDYLPYLNEIKYYKSSKTQAVLARIFPTEVIEILNLIIRDYETKTAAENSRSVYHGIMFSTNYVKQQTGLSYSKQQRALNLLCILLDILVSVQNISPDAITPYFIVLSISFVKLIKYSLLLTFSPIFGMYPFL